jgi:hypothetical protein
MVPPVLSLETYPHLASPWEGEGWAGVIGEIADKPLDGPSPFEGEVRWGLPLPAEVRP